MDSSSTATSRFSNGPIVEALGWLLPFALAVLGHAMASIKVGMPFIVDNARTDFAERTWYFMSGHAWLFAAYAMLLIGMSVLLRRLHCPGWVRLAVLCMAAIPAAWYFRESWYLFGKIIVMY